MRQTFVVSIALVAVMVPSETLAQWDEKPHPTDAPKRHVEKTTTGKHVYVVKQGGTMDGANCRSPIGVGMSDGPAIEQTWESNRAVRLENVGDTDVVNPWLSNGRNQFRNMDEIVASAVKPGMTDREKAHALWFQEIRHRYHWAGDNNELGDPVKVFNVYGHNTCGNDSICLAGLWKRAGLKVTPAHVVGHCVTQCYFDGRWNLFDGDMHSMYLLRDSHTVASEQDLVRDHDLIRRTHTQGILNPDRRANDEWGASIYLFEGTPGGDRNCVQDTTMNMVLRPGEAITWRWGHAKPIRFHGQKPRYPNLICNGVWEYRPDFARDLWKKGAASITDVATKNGELVAEDGKAGAIVWIIRSPYVLGGGKLDVEGSDVKFSLSWDGKTWLDAGPDLDKHFPPDGPARYAYHLRCELGAGAVLKRLSIVNDIQMAPLALPAMSIGDNKFVYTDASPGERQVRITHNWVERSASRPPEAPSMPTFPPDQGDAEGTQLVFRWPAPKTADGDTIADYHFELSDRRDMSWPLSPNFYKLLSKTADRGKAQYTLPHGGLLAVDRKYYWRVRAKNAAGVWGPWSATWNFTPRGPMAPVNVALAVDRKRGTGVLHWKPSPTGRKPAKYRIYGSDEKGFTVSDEPYTAIVGISKMVSTKRPANFVSEVDASGVDVIGADVKLSNANLAYYRVVAVDEKGNRSGPSDFAETNRPVLWSRPVTTGKVGAEYRYAVTGTRSLGDLRTRVVSGKETMNYWDIESVRFTIKYGPDWLKIDEQTGVLRGVPDEAGKFDVAIVATIDREARKLDQRALSWGQEKILSTTTQRTGVATQTFKIEVTPRAAKEPAKKGAAQVPAITDAVLPVGVKAVWDIDKAHREKTLTRERICLNGLWRWQPAKQDEDGVPGDRWGYFMVPGFWPGTASYIQEDCQTLHVHPSWKNADVRNLTTAWYQREFTLPADWNGRRIALTAEYVNSFAIVFVDGKKVGEIRFPGGELDLTKTCKPGGKHTLSMLVVALPLKGVLLSYSDTNAAREVKGSVERRGLCGDVWLSSTPAGPRITDVKVDTSLRQNTMSVTARFEDLMPGVEYSLRLDFPRPGKPKSITTVAQRFTMNDLKDGRLTVTRPRSKDGVKDWDIHTPENMNSVKVYLLLPDKNTFPAVGKFLDTFYPVRFGLREFTIDGKDFYLNGKRIFLSAVPLDNGQLGARTASYAGALETMKRLKSFGINFVYTHNYGCLPGSHVSFNEILSAADDVGMLVGFSQPHFGHYDWKSKDAERDYARHAEFYVRAAQNHPSVVAYSMSHNATGYDQDMNPDMIDGIQDPRKDAWSQNNSKLALRAEAIVKRLDPSRIVYHHSSGNLGSMHTSNFYINFAPIQEVSDWFEHWSRKGVKPMFPVEYGVPFSWDWTMYRGWYKGERNFGSAKVPWEFCLAEWNAQFVGDRAYKISEREKQNLRFEAKQFKDGKLWHRWDYPTHVGSRDLDERDEIFARYITDNWRAFRTHGLSANSPWEHHIYWKLKEGVKTGRRNFKVDWDKLQKPGFAFDYTQRQNWQFVTDFDATDWVPTAAAKALVRNNTPLLAYIGGKPAFTSKDHNYRAGDIVEKQLIVINNSRETVQCFYNWSFMVKDKSHISGQGEFLIDAGQQHRLPLQFRVHKDAAPGSYELSASVVFPTGAEQEDTVTINVLPDRREVAANAKIALFDPKGDTAKLLDRMRMKVEFTAIDANADLKGHDLLIIGKDALTPDGPGPNVMSVRDGLKVIVFEQSAKTLEQRFGFRVAEYGLREVFQRVPYHPLLAGLSAEHLHDWRGEATLSSPRLDYTLRPRYGPTVKWCDIEVPRVWRCGNRGNVASVLIEKPACGNFLSIVDGGYALQYSPLMEYREGKGVVLFCQMDVTGRTEDDPAADVLVRNLLNYASTWKPRPQRNVMYAGEAAGKKHLQSAGLKVADFAKDNLADHVLIVGPGGGKQLAPDVAAIGDWLKRNGRVLALGLDDADANAFLPTHVKMKKTEHIAAHFDAPAIKSVFAGVGPADVHNRDPRMFNLVESGAAIVGNGVLAHSKDGHVAFCQIVPWHFDPDKQMNLKRTFRRTSCAVTRIATNLGAASDTPILTRFHSPAQKGDQRWLHGLYLDVPSEWDDPYRFFRW